MLSGRDQCPGLWQWERPYLEHLWEHLCLEPASRTLLEPSPPTSDHLLPWASGPCPSQEGGSKCHSGASALASG